MLTRRLQRIGAPLVACLLVGVFASSCSWDLLWASPPGSSLPFGLGDNGQANVTLDGNYVDVTLTGNYSTLLDKVENNCIQYSSQFESYNQCVTSVIDKYIPNNYFGGIVNYALQDPNCVVPGTDDPNECTYGQSMYAATFFFDFGLGGSGCLGFRVNLLDQRFEQGSWYAEQRVPSQAGYNVPGEAFCYQS